MTPDTITARIAAELAVHRGDLAEASRILAAALRTAAPEHRPDLEEALAWLDEIVPPRDSWVGEA